MQIQRITHKTPPENEGAIKTRTKVESIWTMENEVKNKWKKCSNLSSTNSTSSKRGKSSSNDGEVENTEALFSTSNDPWKRSAKTGKNRAVPEDSTLKPSDSSNQRPPVKLEGSTMTRTK